MVKETLRDLDGLLASTLLGVASLIPGPAGVSVAAAAAAFDFSRRYWVGALLSGLSMIPLIGYAPAAAKVARNLVLVSDQLSKIEALLPRIEESPALLAEVQRTVGKYAGKGRGLPLAATVFSKVSRIMEYAPLPREVAGACERTPPPAAIVAPSEDA